ncbi:MAG: VIT family protein [Acidobacteria bacterium]|nr:VIT family protein [Acidobacteriota bacterium]
MRHSEFHRTERIGWLRAAVLGANDGIVSTASLVIGVAAAAGDRDAILIAGIAGLVAGAMSMAAGEYVSVYSQADTERADLEREKKELEEDPEGELAELTGIYIDRGLSPGLAKQVAEELTAGDKLAAHARDELGLTEELKARPVQAAVFSALSFAAGALIPLALAWGFTGGWLIYIVGGGSLISLALLGALAARTGGADPVRGAARVAFWGAAAMIVTALVGKIFGTTVG